MRYWLRCRVIDSWTDDCNNGLAISTLDEVCLPKDDILTLVKERPFAVRMLDSVEQNSVVADIGSYHGLYGILSAAIGASVTCFEPDDENRSVLQRNIDANEMESIQVNGRVVWSESGNEVSFSQQEDSGSSIGGSDVKKSVKLDEYYSNKQRPDVLKIDVEGAEMAILKGTSELLEDERPDIFIEIHPKGLADFGSSKEKLVEFLRKNGYRINPLHSKNQIEMVHASPR